jgi:hypothetical protein
MSTDLPQVFLSIVWRYTVSTPPFTREDRIEEAVENRRHELCNKKELLRLRYCYAMRWLFSKLHRISG